MSDLGSVLDKEAVREVLTWLVDKNSRRFSEGTVGIEQATNRILQLQRPPANIAEAALTYACPHCGYNPGNACRWGDRVERYPHPSRVALVFATSSDNGAS